MSLLLGVIGCFFAVTAFAVLLETPRTYLAHAGAIGAVGGFVYLFIHNRIIYEIQVVAEVIAQLLQCKYLTVDSRNLIGVGRVFIMTKN